MPDALIGGVVGPQAPRAGDGVALDLSLDFTGAVLVSQRQPRYQELTSRKQVFVAYSLSQALSLAGAAMVGLQLYNASPIGTGAVNLVLLKLGGFVKATSATMLGIVLASGAGQVNPPTGQTAATRVTNAYLGGAGPVAVATTAATFVNAPTAFMNLLHNTAAIASTGEDPGFFLDLEGSIIVPPQSYVCLAALAAAAGAGAVDSHIMWAEVLA